ncbi:MAG: exodeoxyribonuclease VII large subunit, partial [Planctomycetia bacterium]
LDALSPPRVLARGYAAVSLETPAGPRPVRGAADVAPGDRLNLRLADGVLRAVVDDFLPNPAPSESP